jgi:hypothetical protein
VAPMNKIDIRLGGIDARGAAVRGIQPVC